MLKQTQQLAFTLIEIMVTMAIVVFFMGTIAVSLGSSDSDKDLYKEALRFKSLMKVVLDESIFKRKEIGIKFSEESLQFLVFNPRERTWEAISEDNSGSSFGNFLKEYTFEPFVDVDLEMEDIEVFFNTGDELEQKLSSINPLADFDDPALAQQEAFDEEVLKPDVFVFSSGELTAFSLTFSAAELDEVYTIEVNDIGRVICRAEHEFDEEC